jgi:hypothetical protein
LRLIVEQAKAMADSIVRRPCQRVPTQQCSLSVECSKEEAAKLVVGDSPALEKKISRFSR